MSSEAPKIGTARELQEKAEFMLERAHDLAKAADAEKDKKKKKKLEEEARDFAEQAQELTQIAREIVQE